MKMKKKILFICTAMLLSAVSVFSDTVYLDELQTAGNEKDIVFQNYTGPHNKIDTIAEIRGIGSFLGRDITRNKDVFNFYGKYRVIHAVDYEDLQGLDADIFILDDAAAVDHIINLRRIIAGFLETAYGYSTDQADMLAEFITIYNAVHRKDMEYFSVHYKDVVIENLDAEKAGIALSYREWPGKTMMVIPLTPAAGTDVTGDLDTDLLTEDEVIQELRTEQDKGIDSRQEMVELKEDEIDEQREELKQVREVLDEKAEKLADEKTELEKEAEETGDDERKAEIEKAIEEISEQQKAVEDEKESLKEKEKELGDREDKVAEERERIAEDQSEKIKEEAAAAAASAAEKASAVKKQKKVPFLKISGEAGNYTGQLVLVDTEGGTIIKSSEIDSIRLRGYLFSEDEVVSVAGSTGGTRIISLVKIDTETLEVIETGTEEVYIDSAVIKSGGNYYAVVKRGSDWRIGIFDKNLMLESVSGTSVFPATDIRINSSGVIAQNPAGKIILIMEDDFTE